MCKETRINATNELQFDSDAILYPQECALDSSTFFGVTSSASGKKIEDGAGVLPSGNTPHSDNNNTKSQQEDDEDPHDTMITFLTGRTKSERSSKERAIIFPVKVSPLSALSVHNEPLLVSSDEIIDPMACCSNTR